MAINYTTLFQDLGEFLEGINEKYTWMTTTLPARYSEIGVQLSGNGRYDTLDGLEPLYESFQDQTLGWIGILQSYASRRLTHLTTIIEQLPLPIGAGISQVLAELIRDMIANSQTINKSTVTLGSVTANGTNIGDTTILTTKLLDGVTPPWQQANAIPQYANVNSELVVASETITLTCTRDSETDGVSEGSESWDWQGGASGGNLYDWRGEGSGSGPSIQTANAAGIVTNGEFENFTVANTPDNWAVDNGTVGTTILKDASDFKRGAASLKFTGNGAEATQQISQPITTLTPLRCYGVALWVKGQSGIAAGALTISFTGTGYSASSTEKISLNAAALAALTSWTLKNFFVVLPATLPSDWKLVISVGSTLTNAKSVRFDGLVVKPVDYHGGFGVIAVAGATPALRRDRYTFTVANNDAGVFQKFMRKTYLTQLPSSASSSIDDALASD
jgi:hypothetical protein